MWEITLSGKPNDIVFFIDLKNYLKKLNKKNLIVITFEKDLICSIALIKDKKFYKAINKIYETILKIVKIEYLSNNLNVFCSDKSLNSYFVSSLISYDIANEIKYAMRNTKLSKFVCIRSFVNFKLNNFLEIWQREVDYYNFHFVSNGEDNYLHLLKFLALNIRTKFEIMYLEEINSRMYLLDKKKNKMKNLNIDDDIGIIASLIMFAPKKIIINSPNSLSLKVTNLISYIFEDRVSVLL